MKTKTETMVAISVEMVGIDEAYRLARSHMRRLKALGHEAWLAEQRNHHTGYHKILVKAKLSK